MFNVIKQLKLLYHRVIDTYNNLRIKNSKSYYRIEDFIEKPNEWHDAVCTFLKIGFRDLKFFKNVYVDIEASKSNSCNKENLYLSLKRLLAICDDDYEKVICFRFMIDSELLKAEELKEYVSLIYNLKNPHMQFCLHVDIHSYVFRHNQFIYDEYYNDRRKCIYKIAQYFNKKREIKFINNESNRIAILVKQLQSTIAATTLYVLQDAMALAKAGKEVQIFVSGYFYCNSADSYIKPKFPNDSSENFKQIHSSILDDSVKVFYTTGNSIEKRLNLLIDKIIEYCPEAIIDYSGNHAMETAILIKFFPILYVPLSGLAVCDIFHKFMCQDLTETIKLNKRFNSVKESEMILYDKPIRSLSPKKIFRREKYGFHRDDFIIVTVGTRIVYELSEECIDVISQKIEEIEMLKWIIVSGEEHPYIKQKYKNLLQRKKIILWGFEKDIAGLYTMCNAYINPNRMGGGASIAYAMHIGLPILMNYYPSDALSYVGKENLTNSYQEMAEKLKKLCYDKQYYEQESHSTRTRASLHSLDNTILQYIQAIKSMKNELKNLSNSL